MGRRPNDEDLEGFSADTFQEVHRLLFFPICKRPHSLLLHAVSGIYNVLSS